MCKKLFETTKNEKNSIAASYSSSQLSKPCYTRKQRIYNEFSHKLIPFAKINIHFPSVQICVMQFGLAIATAMSCDILCVSFTLFSHMGNLMYFPIFS